MDSNELIDFNPILKKAWAEREEKDDVLKELVAATVRIGADPALIYAVIKTGRIVTENNKKLLTKADIKEWNEACKEYDRLARAAVKKKRQLQPDPHGESTLP